MAAIAVQSDAYAIACNTLNWFAPQIEAPADTAALHDLILEVKRLGSRDPSLRPRFQRLVERRSCDDVVLACTKLPLIADMATRKNLVDVTELVANALVARSAGFDVPPPAAGR